MLRLADRVFLANVGVRNSMQQHVHLADPAQSLGEQMFKGSNLVHSTTGSEKSSQRYEIQTKTENSCQMAKEPHIKTDKNPLSDRVLGSYLLST
jgi:hypothetical protein